MKNYLNSLLHLGLLQIIKMKCYIFLFLIVFGVFFLSSCKHTSTSLEAAESLIETQPDSALKILDQIKKPRKKLSERNYALYALLTTQAMTKCGLDLSEDSLSEIAVRYFAKVNDSVHAAKACLYAGKVLDELKNPEQAIQYYLRAKDYMNNSRDYKYQFIILHSLGTVYFSQWLYADQLKTYQEAYHYASLKKDSLYLCVALSNIGLAYSGLQKEDSALFFQDKALQMAYVCYPPMISGLYHHISAIYKRGHDYEKAIQYVDSALMISPNNASLYFTKGDSYNEMMRYDSALHYLNKSVLDDNLYTKAASCETLASVYHSLNKLDSAYSYMRRYNVYRDSIEEQTHTAAVLEMENLYHHTKLKEENYILKENDINKSRLIYLILFIVSLLLLFIGILYVYFYNRKQRQIHRAQQQLRQKEIERLQTEAEVSLLEKKELELREAFYRQMNSLVVPKLHSLIYSEKSSSKVRVKISEEEWQFIVENTNVAFSNFAHRLLEAYPALDINDIRLCCLIKMQLRLSDIAEIYCVEKSAINKRRERIRKNKMGLNDGRTLNDILKEF